MNVARKTGAAQRRHALATAGALRPPGRALCFVGVLALSGCASDAARQSGQTSASNETRNFLVDGNVVDPESPEASKVENHFREIHRREHCTAQALVDGALPALEAHASFPIANNQPPAAKFVEGFIKLRTAAQKLRINPKEYPAIWLILTEDGDKAFNVEERDEAVRLWKAARRTFGFSCPRPPA